MDLDKKNTFLLVAILMVSLSCKTINYNSNLYLKNKFSNLKINGNRFEFHRTDGLGKNEISCGNVIYKKGKYILNSFDSLTSTQISFKSFETHESEFSKDSIKIIFKAPLNKIIKNANKFCDNIPYIISINKPLTSKNDLRFYDSSEIVIPRGDIFNVFIYPKTTCGYPITKEPLFFVLNIYESNTNRVEIELPDLNFNRFSYFNLVNCELVRLDSNKFELRSQSIETYHKE